MPVVNLEARAVLESAQVVTAAGLRARAEMLKRTSDNSEPLHDGGAAAEHVTLAADRMEQLEKRDATLVKRPATLAGPFYAERRDMPEGSFDYEILDAHVDTHHVVCVVTEETSDNAKGEADFIVRLLNLAFGHTEIDVDSYRREMAVAVARRCPYRAHHGGCVYPSCPDSCEGRANARKHIEAQRPQRIP
jgi:hypothetical protein